MKYEIPKIRCVICGAEFSIPCKGSEEHEYNEWEILGGYCMDKDTAEFILNVLHDLPTEEVCRYFINEDQQCLYKKEDDYSENWCNNCACWHIMIENATGAKTVYSKHPNATGLKASMLKSLFEEEDNDK